MTCFAIVIVIVFIIVTLESTPKKYEIIWEFFLNPKTFVTLSSTFLACPNHSEMPKDVLQIGGGDI